MLMLVSLAQAIDPSTVKWDDEQPAYWIPRVCILLTVLLAITVLLFLIRRGNAVRWAAFGVATVLGVGISLVGWWAGPYLGLASFVAVCGVGFVVDHLTAGPPLATRAPGFPMDRPSRE